MVESEAQELPESTMLDAVNFGHEFYQNFIKEVHMHFLEKQRLKHLKSLVFLTFMRVFKKISLIKLLILFVKHMALLINKKEAKSWTRLDLQSLIM